MKIIADQNIPFAKEAFGTLGEVITIAGNEITNSTLKEADMLFVRSVTKVNRELIEGTPVKFVGTATIGRDHIDEEYLHEANIGFSSAPGCNANSVVEWVLTAILLHCYENKIDFVGKTLAIVGVGNIGSILYDKAKTIGFNLLLNDPIKKDEGNSAFEELEEILPKADFVSFHVPLTYDGKYPTVGMINDNLLSLVKDGAVLINASRGRTAIEEAILTHAERLGGIYLDVWPNEPNVSKELLDLCRIGTPHIAGYSFDGKCTGTGMVYRAATHFFYKTPLWDEKEILDNVETDPISYDKKKGVAGVLLDAYDILGDDKRFRKIIDISNASEQATFFHKLRKEYPKRYEFCHYSVVGCDDSKAKDILTTLGFTVSED